MLAFYHRWANAADDRLRWLPGRVEPERFGSREEALAWLDGERAGLVGAVLWGREERFADTVISLGLCLAEYLDWRRYFDDLITVSSATRDAAHEGGDREDEAMAWNNLGNALQEAGRVEEAIHAHTHARDMHQTTGDHHGEAGAWNNLGNALQEAGQGDKAITAYGRSLEMRQEFGDWYEQGQVLHNLALAYKKSDRPTEARPLCLQAADAYTRANAPTEAAEARARAEALE